MPASNLVVGVNWNERIRKSHLINDKYCVYIVVAAFIKICGAKRWAQGIAAD